MQRFLLKNALKRKSELRFFEEMNVTGDPCPICRTFDKTKGRVLLIPIPGTEEGNNVKAQQIHEDCARLVASSLLEALDKA